MLTAIKRLFPASRKDEIKNFVRRSIFGEDAVIAYQYSSSGEDLQLARLFSRKIRTRNTGFYVDVGAWHPIKSSNTYLFYRHGWRGINIDARPGSMIEFQKTRSRDINVEAAISDSNDYLDYHEIGTQGDSMNSMSLEFLRKTGVEPFVQSSTRLKAVTLKDLLDQHLPQGTLIDFMNIDVEGWEIHVLKSNDWNRFRPRILIVEILTSNLIDSLSSQPTNYLAKNGYAPFAQILVTTQVSSIFYFDTHISFVDEFG
jgi:FkbM family methyltransferase